MDHSRLSNYDKNIRFWDIKLLIFEYLRFISSCVFNLARFILWDFCCIVFRCLFDGLWIDKLKFFWLFCCSLLFELILDTAIDLHKLTNYKLPVGNLAAPTFILDIEGRGIFKFLFLNVFIRLRLDIALLFAFDLLVTFLTILLPGLLDNRLSLSLLVTIEIKWTHLNYLETIDYLHLLGSSLEFVVDLDSV